MTAMIAAHSPPSPGRINRPYAIRRGFEIATAAAAIGMLVFSAAFPDDRKRTSPDDVFTGRPPAFLAASENVFGVYLGAPYHYPSDVHLKRDAEQHSELRDFVVHDVAWYTHPFDNPLYYGARILHWWPGGRFGSMIDFTHSKAYAPRDKNTKFTGSIDTKPVPESAKIGDYFALLSFSHGHNMLTLNGMMRLARFGFIWPYIGIGGGVSLPHTEIHLWTDKTRTYEYQYTGLNGQALAGLEFRLPSGSLFLEYKFTFASYDAPITGEDGSWLPFDLWRQFTRWWSGAEPAGGRLTTELASHQVIGGFYARFAPKTAAP